MREDYVLRFFCSGCGKEYKTKQGCRGHEKRCWFMPHMRACPTCEFSVPHEEEIVIGRESNGDQRSALRANGYDCMNPHVSGHCGEYAEAFNLSVNCAMHVTHEVEDDVNKF